jgi:predicted nucleic acid-binding protein
MVAPDLLIPEVSSIIRGELFVGRTVLDEAETAMRALSLLPISLYPTQTLMDSAWTWGTTLNTPRLYDLYYLALADQLDCDLWVVDKKLVNVVAGRTSRVRWVGDLEDGANS